MKKFVSITEVIFVLNRVLPYKNIRDVTSGANYVIKYA